MSDRIPEHKIEAANRIRESTRVAIERMVTSTENSLAFAAPETHRLHLNRLATGACQAGIEMALALKKLQDIP